MPNLGILFHSPVFSNELYRTLIRPIVKYASETWGFKENSIQKLMILERKIFGPTKELNGLWRI
jgi:hypothetical protein